MDTQISTPATSTPVTGYAPDRTSRDLGLVRGMGAFGLAAAIFNTVVGAGIFVIPASLARDVGPAAPLAYLACVVAMGAVALCFAAAGSRAPTSGGPYGYAEAAFGPLAGFVVGVLVWLGAVLAAAGIAAAVVDSLAQFAPALARPLPRAATLAALFSLLSLINVAGVTPGLRLVGVLTVAKLAPLLLLLAVSAPHLHVSSLAFGAPSPRALGRAMILALFAFQGMETALGVSGEVKDPARNVPRGLLAAMGSVAVLYIAVQASAQGVLGSALGQTRTPLVRTMQVAAPSLAGVIVLGATVSMLGYLASDTLSAPRILFAFARDGFLPRRVGALQARTRAPYVAILLHAAVAFGLAVSGGFVELAILSSLATVLVYIAGCAAAVRLQRRATSYAGRPFNVRGLEVAAAVGILSMAWIVLHAAAVEALGCAAAIGLAVVWYLLAVARRRWARVPSAPPRQSRGR